MDDAVGRRRHHLHMLRQSPAAGCKAASEGCATEDADAENFPPGPAWRRLLDFRGASVLFLLAVPRSFERIGGQQRGLRGAKWERRKVLQAVQTLHRGVAWFLVGHCRLRES